MPNSTMKAYTRSFIDQDLTGYSLSGDFSSNANVTDRLKTTYAITAGADDDTTSVEFIADMLTDRVIDTVMIKSNFMQFYIQYWDGAEWQNIEYYTDNSDEFTVCEFTQLTTTKIRIYGNKTITPDEEKKIYLLEITKFIAEVYIEKPTIESLLERARYENIYGGSIQVLPYPNHPKVAIEIDFKNLNGSNFDNFVALKEQSKVGSYIVYLYFSDVYPLLGIEAWYLVNDLEDYGSSPADETLAAGINSKLALLEC